MCKRAFRPAAICTSSNPATRLCSNTFLTSTRSKREPEPARGLLDSPPEKEARHERRAVGPNLLPNWRRVMSGAVQQRRRVLIIEDYREVAEPMRQLLLLVGYDVKVASDGLSGVEVAREW